MKSFCLYEPSGTRYSRLVVQNFAGRRGGRLLWRCACECGQFIDVPAFRLRSGNTKSCGCLDIDRIIERNLKHGLIERQKVEYWAWGHIKSRCYNPRDESYADYGGRGIKVANEWAEDFAAFFAHVGARPSPSHSIDRIDVNGHYEPGNVRWATPRQQALNRRNRRRVLYRGREIPLDEAELISPVTRKAIAWRLLRGWSVEDAIERPDARQRG